MLPLPKFIKPWKDAGEANALFAPCAFIDENFFLTKTAAIGVVFEIAGIDPECLTDARMESISKRLAAAWRIFDDNIRLYQYVVKHDGADIDQGREYDSPAVHATVTNRREFIEQRGIYAIRLYLAVLLEPSAIGSKAKSSFGNKWALRVLTRELEETVRSCSLRGKRSNGHSATWWDFVFCQRPTYFNSSASSRTLIVKQRRPRSFATIRISISI